MSSSLRALEAAAFLLPPEERAKLAERLIASLERNPEVEKAWEEEIKRRIAGQRGPRRLNEGRPDANGGGTTGAVDFAG